MRWCHLCLGTSPSKHDVGKDDEDGNRGKHDLGEYLLVTGLGCIELGCPILTHALRFIASANSLITSAICLIVTLTRIMASES